ncbi:MAG TPA: hypothetical protein VND96_02745 [Candidatus Micrarchaeaceae archaeon]|nr:hypothetical protein [Candidatus Micrarchaeaceae archaeon]
MYDPYNLQLAKDRQSALLREAHNESLARLGPRGEPLVKFRLTIELRLGRHAHPMPAES